MPRYPGPPDAADANPPRLGVLLVNLGTPDAPTTAAVRRFLAEFLWDPRVVEAPRLLWWLALHGVILRIRPQRSARAYAQVWTPQGSPLLVHSQALTRALHARLATRFGDRVSVDLAMRYGRPSIAEALERLRLSNVRRLLVLPLYPQYSSSTTGSIIERVAADIAHWRWLPELRFVNGYHDLDAYIDAVADGIAASWARHGRRHLLVSFHSIPQRYVAAGDPYRDQCVATAHRVAARLGLERADWSIGYQSRFGREPWLEPAIDALLARYAKSGPRSVSVACPGFAVDCLETLEEIALRNREMFLAAGGESLDYVPALNAGDAHVMLMERIVTLQTQGWPETSAQVSGVVVADPA